MAIDFRLKYFDVDYDIHKGTVGCNIWAKQGDTGKGIRVQLWEKGSPYTPTSSDIIRLNCLKPDGKRLWLNCDEFEGNLYFKFTNQMFTTIGDVECEFETTSQGVSKKSETFNIEVQKSMSYGAVETYEINIDTIKIGTLASPPENITKGEVWADTTTSSTHPIIRIKL